MKWKVAYYNESVEKNVWQLEKSIKAKYLAIVDMILKQGANLGMPFTKAMGKGLFEIHAKGQAGIARVFFRTIKNNTIVILHIFTKKTEKTPKKRLGFGAENNERGKKL